MSEPSAYRTREHPGGDDREFSRSGESWQAIADTVNALGGPAVIGGAALGVAKHAKDVVVAKIQANAQVEVAKIQSGQGSDTQGKD